jgi:hypothetical protein
MKIWTIYRFQAGDPRERWLRVGQLGTETEQNAIAAARAIWGDGSENHWYYGAEPFPLPGGDAEAETIAEGRFQSVERQLEDIERRLAGFGGDIKDLAEWATRLENTKATASLYWALQERLGKIEKALCGGGPYDPSRSPTRSISPPEMETYSIPVVISGDATATQERAKGIKGTRSAQATGGASDAFSPTVTKIDARPQSWNIFGHHHGEKKTLIGTLTARSKASAFREAETIFRAEVKKFSGWSVEPVEILLPEGETKDTAERIVEATNPAEWVETPERETPIGGPLTGFDSEGHG